MTISPLLVSTLRECIDPKAPQMRHPCRDTGPIAIRRGRNELARKVTGSDVPDRRGRPEPCADYAAPDAATSTDPEVPDVRGLLVFIVVLLLGGGLWAAVVSGCVAS
jgi:hypothetical protein